MTAILALETGQVFYGRSIGAPGMCVGEVVFNTAHTGYQEVLTDPSYTQQIIAFTYPHIGNTGINSEDSQSNKIHAAGMIVRSIATYTSNWRSTQSLQEFLQANNTVAISDVDTRALTKILRDNGALRACIMAGNVDKNIAITACKDFAGLTNQDLTAGVSINNAKIFNPNGKRHVVLLDFGVKTNIINCLTNLDCKVTALPANSTAHEILSLQPDGILLSNGPGDPQACTDIIQTVQQLLNSNIPVFGICLGHQILALALGAKTYKMDFGHHGINHPVQNLANKTVLITSQNHGFAVDESSLNSQLEVTHRSLFDNSLQGFKHTILPLFGFQGHPEAAPGPVEAMTLFADFITSIREHKCQKEAIYERF